MRRTYNVPGRRYFSERHFTGVGENGRAEIRLYDVRTTAEVYWSEQGNSYVIHACPTGFWTAPDGTPCDLLSINGHGEIRWAVSSEQGNTSGDLQAADYFALKWHGWRS